MRIQLNRVLVFIALVAVAFKSSSLCYKLVFAVNLPSGTELREIIKSEFCKEFSNTDVKHFCSRY
jgi:hypothetical protein